MKRMTYLIITLYINLIYIYFRFKHLLTVFSVQYDEGVRRKYSSSLRGVSRELQSKHLVVIKLSNIWHIT